MLVAALSIGALLLTLGPAAAADVLYVYDAMGRLVGVVDAQGNAARYAYDSVGNLLGVSRVNATDLPGSVGITLVAPGKGKVGDTVRLFGKGFSATAGQNTVTFNGTLAVVTAATAVSLTTTVPAGATTGPIAVTTPLGSASGPSFQVLGALAVSPASLNLAGGATQAFQATEGGSPTTNVTWHVNGRVGGSAATGTISVGGLYTAPTPAPQPPSVTITAVHADDPALRASATVTFVPAQAAFLQAGSGLSVQIAAPAIVDQNVRATLSVGLAAAAVDRNVWSAVAVAVQPVVTVDRNVWNAVTVAVQPVVTSVAPGAGARDSVLTLTLTGSGLGGATGVTFLWSSAADGALTVSTLSVNGNGTQATLTLTIAAGAVVGERIVQITTPGGTSSPLGTGGNRFTVQ
jgi:YD repeat-containing protein